MNGPLIEFTVVSAGAWWQTICPYLPWDNWSDFWTSAGAIGAGVAAWLAYQAVKGAKESDKIARDAAAFANQAAQAAADQARTQSETLNLQMAIRQPSFLRSTVAVRICESNAKGGGVSGGWRGFNDACIVSLHNDGGQAGGGKVWIFVLEGEGEKKRPWRAETSTGPGVKEARCHVRNSKPMGSGEAQDVTVDDNPSWFPPDQFRPEFGGDYKAYARTEEDSGIVLDRPIALVVDCSDSASQFLRFWYDLPIQRRWDITYRDPLHVELVRFEKVDAMLPKPELFDRPNGWGGNVVTREGGYRRSDE